MSDAIAIEPGVPVAPGYGSWVLSTIAAGIDRLAVGAARAVIDRTIMPDAEQIEAMQRQAEFYRRAELLTEPRRFFKFLERDEPVPDVVEAPLDPRVRGRTRARVVFPSPYRPLNPAFAAEHARLVENHWVHAETWSHTDRPSRGAIILLHGFGMGGGSRLDALALMAPAFFRSGLDVVLMALPLHGPRSPAGARFSGQLFASPDVVRMNEAMAQAVHDVIALRAWLRMRTRGPIGVLGLSLGGYVAALLAGLVPDLAFVVPVVAPVCFGDLAHRFMGASALHRAGGGLDRQTLRDAYRVHSPLAHAARMARERLMILAAHGDRVVPAEHPRWLEAHWQGPRTVWFSGSHLAPFGRGTMLGAIRRFLCELDVLAAC